MPHKILEALVAYPYDVTSSWVSTNEVIPKGVFVLVDDNGTTRMKIGDGITRFNDLPYTIDHAFTSNYKEFLDKAGTTGGPLILNGNNKASVASLPEGNVAARGIVQLSDQILPTNSIKAVTSKAVYDYCETLHTDKQAMVITDTKPNNSAGGTFSANAWRQRILNTVNFNDITNATLNNNAVSLPAGKYYIKVSAPAYRVEQNRLCLTFGNNPYSDPTIFGQNVYSRDHSGSSMVCAEIEHIVSLPQQTTMTVHHICSKTRNTDGFGLSSTVTDEPNVYTRMAILKLN